MFEGGRVASGFQGVPLGHGRAGVTHHVLPVLHLCWTTLPGEIDLAGEEKEERDREKN